MNPNRHLHLFLNLGLMVLMCAGLARGAAPPAAPKIALADKKILWLGDSITQAGDYVSFVQYYLDRTYPTDKFDIISIGLASETVSGLSEKAHPFPRPWVLERLQRALDKVKPDVVFACYGMNDGIYHPQSDDRMQAFKDGMTKLLASCRDANAQVVLMTPPPFDKVAVKSLTPLGAADYSFMAPYDAYDSVLADYAKWEMSLSPSDALVIDLHTPFVDYLAKRRATEPQFSFTTDGIHPIGPGQLLMAEIILKGLEVPVVFNSDLNAEFAQAGKDPLFGLVKQQREARSTAWLPYVGYTRGDRVKTSSVSDAEKANTAFQEQVDKIRNPTPAPM